MIYNEVYKDIRLVGAPPSNIGKFGGDTDNWMWPRHTGDFSVFRIYVDKDGKPAEYSPDNVPFKPDYHLPISLEGVEEGDFTFVFGYPARTSEYLPSHAVNLITEVTNPPKINCAKPAWISLANMLMLIQKCGSNMLQNTHVWPIIGKK